MINNQILIDYLTYTIERSNYLVGIHQESFKTFKQVGPLSWQ